MASRGWGRGHLLRALLPFVVALLSGALWGACFSRHPGPVLPWLALTPLFLLLGGRRPGLLGMAHGVGAWLVALSWLGPTLSTYGGMPPVAGALLNLVLILYLSLYHALFGRLGSRLWRDGGWRALAALPALWVSLEWLRTHLFGGFPWNLAAYAWVEMPGALPLCAFVGAYGLSGLIVLVNAALALSVRRRRWEPGLGALLVALLGFACGLRFAPGAEPAPGRPRLPLRIVQPNIQNLAEWDAETASASYERLLQMTEEACEQGSLVIWPESAAWPWAYDRDRHLRRDVQRLTSRDCSLLLNTPRFEGEGERTRFFNSALLVEDGGRRRQGYDKFHLVPWGEYVPLGNLLPFVGYLARNAGQFSAGRELSLLEWDGERLGVAICYEVVFPGEVAQRVASGASLLVTVTNDAWYGDTFAPWQHLRAVQFRAAENARPVLRAAITGISAVIDARGGIVHSLGVGAEGVLATRVAGRDERTLYGRLPWGVPALCSLIAAGLIWSSARQRTKRDDTAATASGAGR